MNLFLSVPQKKTSEIDLVSHLQKLIANYYGVKQPEDKSVTEIDSLRKEALHKGVDGKSPTTLAALQKYYEHVKLLCRKCPVYTFPVAFKWKDAFDKGAYNLISSAVSIASLDYERVCVLFNIAASFSENAAYPLNEDINNEYALQLGAKHFQQAAGIFLKLKTDVQEAMGPSFSSNNFLDFDPRILDVLHTLMLAQAQEAVFIKASLGKMKDQTLAKISAQVGEYYQECYKLIQVIKAIWPEREWYNQVQCKKFAYSALADYYMSNVIGEDKKYGEQISWLTNAIEYFKLAEQKAQLPDFLVVYEKKASKCLANAIRDNDFIYHAKVPEYKDLSPIEKVSLVKATPVPESFVEIEDHGLTNLDKASSISPSAPTEDKMNQDKNQDKNQGNTQSNNQGNSYYFPPPPLPTSSMPFRGYPTM